MLKKYSSKNKKKYSSKNKKKYSSKNKNNKNIFFYGGMEDNSKKHKGVSDEESESPELSSPAAAAFESEATLAARELITLIERFLRENQIEKEHYRYIDDDGKTKLFIYLFLRNGEEKIYFYTASFDILKDDDFDRENFMESIEPFFSTLDLMTVRNATSQQLSKTLFISTVNCVLNGFAFSLIIECYIMAQFYLRGILIAEKEDCTDNSNLFNNYNNALGFFTKDHIHFIYLDDIEDVEEEIEDEMEKFYKDPISVRAFAENAGQLGFRETDFTESRSSQGSSHDSFVPDLDFTSDTEYTEDSIDTRQQNVEISVCDSTKIAFLVPSLINLKRNMREFLSRKTEKIQSITKADLLQRITFRKEEILDTPWEYTSPDGYRTHEGVTMLTEISEDDMFSF